MNDVESEHSEHNNVVKNIESSKSLQQETLKSDQSLSLKHKLSYNEEEPGRKKSKKEDESVMDAAEMRRKRREEEKEAKRLKKIAEEEKKREEKRRKKEEEIEKRRLKKEKEEEERIQKRAAIEAEKLAKKQQKEKEKLEKLKKKELEQKQREEKRKLEEQEKALKREEQEKKRELKLKEREDKANEKKRIEEEKKREEEQKKQKRSITNFFKLKSSGEKETRIEGSMSPTAIVSVSTSADNSCVKDAQIKASEHSDFDQFFLPFYINSNVTIATTNRASGSKWDLFLQDKKSINEPRQIQKESRPQTETAKAIDVVQLLNTGMKQEAESLFVNVPLKYIRFYENRKPPYFGTYSHLPEEANTSILTNPFTKIESWKVDYDFDSDFSDAEDDEGEDVDAEDDEEDEEEEEEINNSDIDEFVESDDSNLSAAKRSIVGPLVPLVRCINVTQDKTDNEFTKYYESLQWEALRSDIQFPIDPFTNYWENTEKSQEANASIAISTKDTEETKAVVIDKGPMTIKKKVLSDKKAVKALVQFIKANSSLTINTMAELASKQIPELSKSSRALVKNTIKDVARFDKKSSLWELV